MVTNAIVLLTPEIAIQQAKAAYEIVKRLRNEVFVEGVDFGVIPGTDKPTLYKPGAEKSIRAFGYCPVFETVNKVERWDDESPLFHYEIRCRLIRVEDGKEIATGIGSCNSKESKYRWRWMFDNQVQALGLDLATLVKKTITSHKNHKTYIQYRVPNDDVFSLVNTIEKMACKRALVAAVLIGTNASEFFTQDIEDLRDFGDVVEAEFEEVREPEPPKPQKAEPPVKPVYGVTTSAGEPPASVEKATKWSNEDWAGFWKEALPLYDNPKHGENSIEKMFRESAIQPGKHTPAEALDIVRKHVESGKERVGA